MTHSPPPSRTKVDQPSNKKVMNGINGNEHERASFYFFYYERLWLFCYGDALLFFPSDLMVQCVGISLPTRTTYPLLLESYYGTVVAAAITIGIVVLLVIEFDFSQFIYFYFYYHCLILFRIVSYDIVGNR